MNKIELDKEIKATHTAIKELQESGDIGALKLANADLSYFLTLLDV